MSSPTRREVKSKGPTKWVLKSAPQQSVNDMSQQSMSKKMCQQKRVNKTESTHWASSTKLSQQSQSTKCVNKVLTLTKWVNKVTSQGESATWANKVIQTKRVNEAKEANGAHTKKNESRQRQRSHQSRQKPKLPKKPSKALQELKPKHTKTHKNKSRQKPSEVTTRTHPTSPNLTGTHPNYIGATCTQPRVGFEPQGRRWNNATNPLHGTHEFVRA